MLATGGVSNTPLIDPDAPFDGAASENYPVSCADPFSSIARPPGINAVVSLAGDRCLNAGQGTPAPHFLGCRTDGLTVAYAVDLDEATLAVLRERYEVARDVGAAVELVLPSGLCVSLKRTGGIDTFYWESLEGRGRVHLNAPGGWRLEITFDAVYLATHSRGEIVTCARRIAQGFGAIGPNFHAGNERVRRGDLCADFSKFPLQDIESRALVTQRRARVCAYAEQQKLDGRKRYTVNDRVTGWTVCPGARLMLRVYDKTEELALEGREHKRDLEEDIWKGAGWHRGERVTRVEFQYRTDVLQALGVHTLDDYFTTEDKLWAYGTQTWFSLRVPSEQRKARWALDPRWDEVQQVTFRSRVPAPRKRERRRGGVQVGQARGGVLSLLGGTGRLARIGLVTADGEVLACERQFVERWDARTASAWVRQRYRDYFRDAALLVAETELDRHGPREAARRLIARVNGVVARFSDCASEEAVGQVAA